MASRPVELKIDPSLHHRPQSYDNRTPDGRMSFQEDTKVHDDKPAMTTCQNIDRHSMSSDEDEDHDDLLPPLPVTKGSLGNPKGGFYGPAASASTASLAFDNQQNGFAISKEHVDHDGIELQDVGAGNGRPRSSAQNSERRKLTRKERERQRTIQFAKEMAFVVSRAGLAAMSFASIANPDVAWRQTIPSILLSMLGSVLAGEVLAKLKVRTDFQPKFQAKADQIYPRPGLYSFASKSYTSSCLFFSI
jgi:hypothetical protein